MTGVQTCALPIYSSHTRHLRFYDVKNKSVYNYSGKRGWATYDNYEPFEGNYLDWALKGFKTLER